MNKKVNDTEVKNNRYIEEAKEKGVILITNPELSKKSEELKKKVDIAKQH